jgi:hypothetical protein
MENGFFLEALLKKKKASRINFYHNRRQYANIWIAQEYL